MIITTKKQLRDFIFKSANSNDKLDISIKFHSSINREWMIKKECTEREISDLHDIINRRGQTVFHNTHMSHMARID